MSIVLILTLNLSPYDLGSNDLKFENLNKNQQLSRERTSKLNLEFKIRLAIFQARFIFKSYISYIFIEFLTLECKFLQLLSEKVVLQAYVSLTRNWLKINTKVYTQGPADHVRNKIPEFHQVKNGPSRNFELFLQSFKNSLNFIRLLTCLRWTFNL